MAWIYPYHMDTLMDPNCLFHCGTSNKVLQKAEQPQVENPLLLNMQPNNVIQPLYKLDAYLPLEKKFWLF